MDESEILIKVRKVVADKLDVNEDEVKVEAHFVDDLGADSLDVVELIMELEDVFDLEISDEKAEELETVGDAVTYIASQQ